MVLRNTMLRGTVIALLDDMPDMERIINRVRSGNATHASW